MSHMFEREANRLALQDMKSAQLRFAARVEREKRLKMSDTLQEQEDQNARLIGNPNENADWCDDCHGYTHMPWCPSRITKEVNEQERPAKDVKVDVKISKETGGAYADVRQVIKSELARIKQEQSAARGGGERGCPHPERHQTTTYIPCQDCDYRDNPALLSADQLTKPLAWMRRWAYEGRVPEKVKNAKGRWVWPREARFHDVTKVKACADDVPLYAHNQHQALVAERELLREALQLIQGFNWQLDDSPHGQEIKRRALEALDLSKRSTSE